MVVRQNEQALSVPSQTNQNLKRVWPKTTTRHAPEVDGGMAVSRPHDRRISAVEVLNVRRQSHDIPVGCRLVVGLDKSFT